MIWCYLPQSLMVSEIYFNLLLGKSLKIFVNPVEIKAKLKFGASRKLQENILLSDVMTDLTPLQDC